MIKAKINKSIAAIGIFTVILLVAWFVFFIGLCSSLGYAGFSTHHFENLGKMFAFDFAGRTGPTILALLMILFILFAVFMSVKATLRKKNTISVWVSFGIMFIGCFIALELFFNLTRSIEGLGYVYILSNFDKPTRVLMAFGTIGTGILTWLLSIILWGMVIAQNYDKLENADKDEDKGLDEKALDEKIRQIVIEELEKRPYVTQNFYGVGPEKPIVKQTIVQEVKEVVKEEPKVVHVEKVVVKPVEEDEEEKNKIIRIPFDERLVAAEQDLKDNYNELKNEILSYGVKSRLSNSGDTFRLHRKTFVKISIAGKGLKLYFALNPADYANSTIPVLDVSDKGVYAETPLAFKVKSDLSVKRAKQLIADVMATENLEQGEVGKDDFVKPVRALLKAENRL